MRLPVPRLWPVRARRWSGRRGSSTTSGWATNATRSCTTSTPAPPPTSSTSCWQRRRSSCFGPDTLAEARNRGYHRCRSVRRDELERATDDRWLSVRSGGLKLARDTSPPRRPGRAPGCPRGSCCATASRSARWTLGSQRQHVSRADRSHRQRDGLGGDHLHVPRVRCRARATSRSAAGSTTSRPPSITSSTRPGPTNVWLAGTSTGGSLVVCEGAVDDRSARRGRARLPAPTSTTGPGSPAASSSTPGRSARSPTPTSRRRSTRGHASCERSGRSTQRAVSPRKSLLIVHGDDDEYVPTLDARVLAEAHGSAELRIITGAGHRLRHDPRAVAVLLGWLDRERNRVATSPA